MASTGTMALSKRIFRRPRGETPASDLSDPSSGQLPADSSTAPPSASAALPEPGQGEQHTAVMPAVAAPPETSAEVEVQPAVSAGRPGFRQRGRMRRRLRYLREARELGYRDLGGLVFDQHRFQRPNESLVQGKVAAIDAIDRESRALGAALEDRLPYSELFVAGVSACQRCGGLHGSDARFCPSCGLAFSGPRLLAGLGAEHQFPRQDASTSPGQAALFDPQRDAAPAAVAPPYVPEQQEPPPPDSAAHAAQPDPAP